MKPRLIFISASCLALNLSLGKIAAMLSLPVYFDTVGTILGATLLPPFYAVSLAVMTSFLAGILINPYFVAFTGTQLAVALTAIGLFRLKFFRNAGVAVVAGMVIAFVSVAMSAPISVLLFGGVSLSGTTAINALLLATGQSLWRSVIGGSLIVETVDKSSSALLVWLVLHRLPQRLYARKDDSQAGEP